jgi:hypothetical protein
MSIQEEEKPSDDEAAPFTSNSFPKEQGFGSILRNWWWELATWVLGTIALALIILLLLLFHDHHRSSWHSKVQITAIVSALSQVAQSALTVSLSSSISQLKWIWMRVARPASHLDRFDEASRGPEGSLSLIFSLLPRNILARQNGRRRSTLEKSVDGVGPTNSHPGP